MKKLLSFLLIFVTIQLFSQSKVAVGSSTSNYLEIVNIKNNDTKTIVFLKAESQSSINATLHPPGSSSPFVLGDEQGNRYALTRQVGWKGPDSDGFGSITIEPYKVKYFKLYFNKLDDLDDVYSLTEANCTGSGCWNFYDINLIDKDDYIHQEDVEVEFDKVWVDYDVYDDDGAYGMRFHTKFTLYNMKGMRCHLTIKILGADDEFLISTDYAYNDYYGDLELSKPLRPGYEEAVYNDLILFLPYDEMTLPNGSFVLKADFDLTYENGDLITHLKMHHFTFKQ